MTQKFLSLLGLCMRAGKLISGEDACLQAIRSGTARIAILDGSASENAKKALRDSCTYRDVPLIETGPDELGIAIGKETRKAAVIVDVGFAAALQKAAGAGKQTEQC